MNAADLRRHLDAVTAEVTSPPPSVPALRSSLRRRRTRDAVLAAVVLLVTGLGVGLGLGLDGPRSAVVAGRQPTVTVPCATTTVTLQLGQTLQVQPCAPDGPVVHGLGAPSGSALRADGDQRYTAVRPGSGALRITNVGCVPAGKIASCATDTVLLGTISVAVPGPPGERSETVDCGPGAVQLYVGEQLHVRDCERGTTLTSDDTGVLRLLDTDDLVAVAPGTTSVSIRVTTPCQLAGGPCTAVGVTPGSIRVTVVQTSAMATVMATVVDVPCLSTFVRLDVGQRIDLADCPSGYSSGVLGSHLQGSGSSYTVVSAGSSTVRVTFPSCALVSASARAGCFGGLSQEDLTVAAAGPGPVVDAVTVPCVVSGSGRASVSVPAGDTVVLAACPGQQAFSVAGTSVLHGSAGRYETTDAGTATVVSTYDSAASGSPEASRGSTTVTVTVR